MAFCWENLAGDFELILYPIYCLSRFQLCSVPFAEIGVVYAWAVKLVLAYCIKSELSLKALLLYFCSCSTESRG